MTDGRVSPVGPARGLVDAAAHAFVEDLAHPELTPEDAHHLVRVVRLRDGDPVSVSDGAGQWRTTVLRGTARGAAGDVTLEPTGPVLLDERPRPPIAVAFAVPKGDRPELVVQKLTEIGADEIIPMLTARSVVRWDDARARRHHARFVRIAHEAAAQSRRTWLPTVSPIATFETVVARPGAALAAPGGSGWPSVDAPLILVGPEGGWSDDERRRARIVVGLGPHVLRVETAAIVACTLLVAARARSVNT